MFDGAEKETSVVFNNNRNERNAPTKEKNDQITLFAFDSFFI